MKTQQQGDGHGRDFDRVLDDASQRTGDPWLDALCLAAGQGMAVVCDEDGAIDVVQASVTGEAWL